MSHSRTIHHETALVACQILACNKLGYLSTSRDRNAECVNVALDSIIPPNKYYYHLNTLQPDALYPICRNFEDWEFPHNAMPSSWQANVSSEHFWSSDWTTLSQRIKDRDRSCLVSGWKDSLTTAHVVNKEDGDWLDDNGMGVYLTPSLPPPHHDSRNLFSLRWDLHLGQFDQAQFVIVPKSSKLVIHFLRISQESAQQYHNVIFEHNHTLSHELLYARFAWALMKIVGSFQLNARKFNFLNRSKRWGHDGNSSNPGTRGQGEPSQGGRPKRKRTDNTSDNGDDGDTSPTYHPGSILGHQNGLDNLPLQSNAWLSDVLVKMAPGTPSSLDRDAQEIEKDLAIAASTLPFFVDPTLQANAYHYNEINWYPGRGVVERRKRAYLDQHSNIRAHSDHLLPESYDASDDETF